MRILANQQTLRMITNVRIRTLAKISRFLVDEVIIVDGGSTDKTVEKAKSYGSKVKIFIENNPPMFHINKQKAIERAKGEWILQLDADEALSDELKHEIKTIVMLSEAKHLSRMRENNSNKLRDSSASPQNDKEVAYYIPRKNFFLTRFLMKGGQYPDYTIRLYKNGSARFPCKDVHENVEIINPKLQETRYKQITNNKLQITKKKNFENLNVENYLD